MIKGEITIKRGEFITTYTSTYKFYMQILNEYQKNVPDLIILDSFNSYIRNEIYGQIDKKISKAYALLLRRTCTVKDPVLELLKDVLQLCLGNSEKSTSDVDSG